ncbi:hypothetical protein [Cellulomonas sp. PhB143]|uniref:hypothetical protein n=1 Tax=Cellulomonas sp. PhB143 TaxID=2485186 RepID=UPI0011CDEC8D|nr:hypothetical protein [Cellulomonas sp. PhB143]
MPPTSPSAAEPSGAPGLRRAPAGLRVVVAGAALEVAALVAAAGYALWRVVGGDDVSVGLALGLCVFALGFAAILAGCTRALLRGRRAGRAPVATWQLLQGIVGVTAVQGGAPAWGVPAVVVAAVVLVALMLRPVVQVTAGTSRPAGG